MVADTLNQKSTAILSHIKAVYLPLIVELGALNAELSVGDSQALLANFRIRPTLINEISKVQS